MKRSNPIRYYGPIIWSLLPEEVKCESKYKVSLFSAIKNTKKIVKETKVEKYDQVLTKDYISFDYCQ